MKLRWHQEYKNWHRANGPMCILDLNAEEIIYFTYESIQWLWEIDCP